MPIFDYKCITCDKIYETLIRSISRDVPTCPVCSTTGETQVRQVSAPKLFNGLPMGNGNFDKMNNTKPT